MWCIYLGCDRLGFVQGVLRLLPSVSWDTLQPPVTLHMISKYT